MVFDADIRPPSMKLTALALGDWCNDEGGSLHPSMAAIARKVGVSHSQAQRLVKGLGEMGLLSVIANAHGGSPSMTPRYQMNLARLASLRIGATGSVDATGIAGAADPSHGCARGVAPMRQTGSTHATQTVINHQRTIKEPSKKRTRARSVETTLPHDFAITESVSAWAEKQGWTEYLPAHFEQFIGYAKAKAKTYADWDQAFMNAIRGDWGDVRKRATQGADRSGNGLRADEQFRGGV